MLKSQLNKFHDDVKDVSRLFGSFKGPIHLNCLKFMQINDLATHIETYINDINVFFTVLSKNPATHLIALYFAWEQKGEMGANIHGNTVYKTKMTTTLPLRPFW